MNQDQEKIKYFLYARKSSESEDRQVQSIDDQVNRLKELASELDLEVVKIFRESRSAKQPNNRPIFEEMISKIEAGEATGILCWQINRLSRNPADSGRVQWMLQQEVVKEVRTIDRVHKSDDNALLFSVESGTANQFILDLIKNTKRGLRSKVEKGWYPCVPPLGYENDIRTKTIVKDPERFNLVRKMWDLMLSGNHTVESVLKIANEEWGLTTRKKKRVGGKRIGTSMGYRIFHNPFYYGVFLYKGEIYQGKHEPMVTVDEFERAQEIISGGAIDQARNPRPHQHKFAYTGMIRCSCCGCMVTAEKKKKMIKSTGKVARYVYYRCTRRKKEFQCKNSPITLEELEKQIAEHIGKITIPDEFKEWALAVIREENDKEINERKAIHQTNTEKYDSLQSQLDNLTRLRYREQISDEEFVRERKMLQEEIKKTRQRIDEIKDRAEGWIDITERAFDFAVSARRAFKVGNLETKKNILRALGEDFVLENKKLLFEPSEWLEVISNRSKEAQKTSEWLELKALPMDKAKEKVLQSKNPIWGGQWELNPY